MPLICSPLRMALPLASSPLQNQSRHKQAGDLGSADPWLASLHLGDAAAVGAAPGERESGLECLHPRCNVSPALSAYTHDAMQTRSEAPSRAGRLSSAAGCSLTRMRGHGQGQMRAQHCGT